MTNWVGAQQYNFISAIYFYQFTYNTTNPGSPVILDQVITDALDQSRPSIVVDGNADPHCAWQKTVSGNDNIYYRWRQSGTWRTIELVSNQMPNYADKSPHIGCCGNDLSVVWYDEIDGMPNEILRRRRQIYRPRWLDNYAVNYSQSSGISSEFPVNAAHDFSIWCEIGTSSDYDIRYRSDTYGFGWVSQAVEGEYFCHSQLQRDYYPWDLYTIFTKGNDIPYRIVSVHQQFGVEPPGTLSPLYTVDTGEDSASAFCISRDGAIQYPNHSVDYGNSKITYNLSLLDPTFPYHLLKGTAYFEGSGSKTHEVWVNGAKKLALVVPPNQAYNFEVPIPRASYANTHQITLTIKNPQTNGVYLSDLQVYRLAEEWTGGGGPQSSNSVELRNAPRLTVTPNPFNSNLTIKFQISSTKSQTNSKCKIQNTKPQTILRIYDATGRVVKSFNLSTYYSLLATNLQWDGTDASGNELPNGIYFIELKTNNESITKEIILLK